MDDSRLLTHDQSQHMEQIQAGLDDRDRWNGFPPEGGEIVSWVVTMGVRQTVTLRLPARLLNTVNGEPGVSSPPSSIQRVTSCPCANVCAGSPTKV
jgi:hypothetical protein